MGSTAPTDLGKLTGIRKGNGPISFGVRPANTMAEHRMHLVLEVKLTLLFHGNPRLIIADLRVVSNRNPGSCNEKSNVFISVSFLATY